MVNVGNGRGKIDGWLADKEGNGKLGK